MVPVHARAHRIDSGSLRKLREVSGGGIRVDAQLTRSGVFEYHLPDGTVRREYRPPEEVFKRDSMDSLDCVPVGDDHPDELLDLETEHEYRRGLTGEHTRKDGDWLVNSIVVRDPALIEKMKRGKVFVSCGYDCDLEEKPGTTPLGERYDAIQRNITYNHVAIVDVPRAGARARVRMDGGVMQFGSKRENSGPNGFRYKVHGFKTQKKDSKEIPMPNLKQKLAKALKENEVLKARADAAEARFDAAECAPDEEPDDEEKMDEEEDVEEEEGDDEKPAFLKGKKKDSGDYVPMSIHARAVARADAAEAEVKRLRKARLDSADVRRLVRERTQLERLASPFLEREEREDGESFDLSDLSDREVKVAVIKAVERKDCSDKKFSDDYIAARFDSIVERHDESEDDDLETEEYAEGRFDAADGDAEAQAARKMRERSANRWQRRDAADNEEN